MDPDPIRIQGFDDQKLKKITAEKKIVRSKSTFTYPYAYIKNVQVTEESPQKRRSDSSKHELLNCLLLF
jgi:hypothetical protein